MVCEQIHDDWDIRLVLVDDCSSDGTLEKVFTFASARKKGPELKLISLNRNSGHPAALTAGLLSTRQNACALVLDSDLQDPPEVIPKLLERLTTHDVVTTRRVSRRDSWPKRFFASLFYLLMNTLTGGKVAINSGDFWAIAENQVAQLKRDGIEKSVFFRGLVLELSDIRCVVEYERHARYAGKTKYTLGKMLSLAISGIGSYSDLPLKIVGTFTAVVSILGLMGLGAMVWGRLTSSLDFSPGLVIFSFIVIPMLAVNAFSLTMVALYLSRLSKEVSPKKPFVVSMQRSWRKRGLQR